MTAPEPSPLQPTSSIDAATAPTVPDVPRTLGLMNRLILIGVAIVVLFAFLGFHRPLTEHEVFASEPAREMLDGGSLALQPFAGAYRVKKPPGQSWLIATSLALTGTRNEFTARLPSAIAGTLAALMIASLGARLGGRRLGLIAGLMALTCYAIQVRARLAEADMALALCVLIANATVLKRLLSLSPGYGGEGTKRGTLWRAFVFWLAIAAGFVIKGPIVLLFTLLPAAILLPLLRRQPAFGVVRRIVFNPFAFALFLLIVSGWIATALIAHPQVFNAWWHELFERKRESGADPIWAYAGFVPMALLPWTPFALAEFGRLRLREPARLLLALWAMLSAIAISLVAFKRMHYALPLLPPLILLCARGFNSVLSRFVANKPNPDRLAGRLIFVWFGIVSIAWLVNQIVIEPRDKGDQAVLPFAREVNERVPAVEPIYFVGVGEERTAWYLSRQLIQTRLTDDDTIETQMSRLPTDRVAYVLCRVPNVPAISSLANVSTVARSEDFRGRGEDVERRVLLRVQRLATTQPSTQATLPEAQP